MAKSNVDETANTGCGCATFFFLLGGLLIYNGKLFGFLLLLVGFIVLWVFSDTIGKSILPKEDKRKPTYRVMVSVDDSNDFDYSIKGINFCGIDDSMLGDFEGTARALRSNTHDPYAIGIYRGNKRVGFLPRGNKELHARIMANGGSTGAMGYIAKAEENGSTFYYGKVNIMGL